MGNSNNDLTAITDLSEFVHPDDKEADNKFRELESLSISIESPPDLPIDESEPTLDATFDATLDSAQTTELTFDESSENASDQMHSELEFDGTQIADVSIDFPIGASDLENNQESINEEIIQEEVISIASALEADVPAADLALEKSIESINEVPELQEELPEEAITSYQKPENFNEVSNFAQNFSYGEIPAGGNPPFSLIIKNIKFKEEADDIMALLNEYKVVSKENEKEFIRALEYGTVLVPQINEYLAIILTHKFRRFDCEIEMGLSDQIQPPKDSEYNPRGLTNKNQLKQNKVEQFKHRKEQAPLTEILASTTPTLDGFKITKYFGVETSVRIIETLDLERLHFIHQTLHQSINDLDEETKSDYLDFSANFHQIYTDLLNEIKEHAFIKNANAVLGVSFSLSPILALPHQAQNKYQLTCTATIVNVTPELTVAADETV